MTDLGRKTTTKVMRFEAPPGRGRGRAHRRAAREAPRQVTGIANLVRDTLIPVEPSQQFVRELGRSLTATATRSRRSLVRRYRAAIVIGAAAFGSLASVVGIVALLIRQRSRVRTG